MPSSLTRPERDRTSDTADGMPIPSETGGDDASSHQQQQRQLGMGRPMDNPGFGSSRGRPSEGLGLDLSDVSRTEREDPNHLSGLTLLSLQPDRKPRRGAQAPHVSIPLHRVRPRSWKAVDPASRRAQTLFDPIQPRTNRTASTAHDIQGQLCPLWASRHPAVALA